MIRPLLILVALLLALGLLAKPAQAQRAEQLWTDATNAMAEHEDAQAAALLQSLVREFPNHALADDALFLAGNLFEEKLSKPQLAREQYRKLLSEFPDSRSALAAQRRLEVLDKGLGRDGEGEQVLIQFEDILQNFPSRTTKESLAMAKALAQDNPTWPQVQQIHLWIAATAQREGDLKTALRYYRLIVQAGAPANVNTSALLGITEVAILDNQLSLAANTLDTLKHATGLSAAHQQALKELRENLSSARRRNFLLSASYGAFILISLLFMLLLRRRVASWKDLALALRKPATEVLYMLPICALLIAMAMTGHREIGPAVAIICVGGLFITHLLTAVLAHSRPLSAPLALVCASASTLATVAVCYVALQRSELLELVATTVRFGPE